MNRRVMNVVCLRWNVRIVMVAARFVTEWDEGKI